MIKYGPHGQQLYDNGYSVIPLHPRTKIPTEGWMTAAKPPAFSKYPGYSIGVRCGTKENTVYAVDLDIKNAAAVKAVVQEMNFKEKMYRIGSPPKRLYLFKGLVGGLRKRTSAKYEEGHIEILGYGQQFAAFGVHPKTKRPYQWPKGSPLTTSIEHLPVVAESEFKKLLEIFDGIADTYGFTLKESKKKDSSDREYDPDNPLFEKEPIGASEEELIKMVNALDPDCGRDQWRDIGFALHHETEGSEAGFRIWDEWSSLGDKYKEGETEKQWNSFGRSNTEPVTAASIIKWYKEKKLEEADDKLKNEIGIDPEDPFANSNWFLDRFSLSPPRVEMIVESIIPKGITALVFSAGGAGKSTLMLYLATRMAFANYFPCDFAGYNIHGGSVVILTAEDPDTVLNRRYVAIITELSKELNVDIEKVHEVLKDKLRIESTFGKSMHLFGLKNEIIKPTKAFVSLMRKLKKIDDLQLLVVDTKTRYSPGEGMGNVTASQEITYYEMLAQATDATVILLHHTNKKSRDGSQDGAQAYRDATAWFDNTRASWFFRPVTKKEASDNKIPVDKINDYFILENAKNNYVKRHTDKIVHRSGYSFFFSNAITVNGDKEDTSDRHKQDLMESIVSWMQSMNKNELRQAEIMQWCKNEINAGRTRVLKALDMACDDGILELVDGRIGKTKRFGLTEYGLLYNLHID